jgi:UbiD family decarboxylase
LRDAKTFAPNVRRIALPAPLTVIVALDKTDDDQPQRLIEGLLRSDVYTKQVIVVDGDVDPGDLRQVLASMALKTQADQRVFILPREDGTPLDPSCPNNDGKTAKIGIDATQALKSTRAITRNRIPQAVLDAIDLGALLGKK